MRFKDLNVMAIDDSIQVLEQVEAALRDIGIENITCCSNPVEAKQKLDSGEFDLVICDQKMPEMNGMELLNDLRTNPKNNETPFILLTSDGNRQTIVMLVSNKGNGFLVKPPNKDKLKEKIIEVMTSQI
jgi:two-component system chemotaxis response regulator CheY